MAAYALPDDVRLVLSPQGDENHDSSTAASLADDELVRAISRATVQIDAALRQRYELPFPSVPPIVASLAADLAGYYATLTYRRGGGQIPADSPVRLRYDAAVAQLADLAAGRTTISPPADSATAVVVNVVPYTETYYQGWGWPGEGTIQSP